MHPFTIASVSASDGSDIRRRNGEEGMILMCKRTGTWTKRLYEMAKMSAYVDGFLGREVKVWIEGPYGALFGRFSLYTRC